MRTVRQLLILTALLVLGVTFTAYAQEDLDETFTAADDSYTFDHPRGWTVLELESTGSALVTNSDATVVVSVFAPLGMETILGIGARDDAEDALDAVVGFLEGEATDDPESDSLGGREALYVEFETDSNDGWGGVIEFSDGGFGALMATYTRRAPDDVIDTLLAMLETLDVPNGERDDEEEEEDPQLSNEFPTRIRNIGPDFEDTIEELLDAEVIPDGGDLEFDDESVSLEGDESLIERIGSRTTVTNFILSGELIFESSADDEFEVCAFSMRNDGAEGMFIDIGLANTGIAFLFDVTGPDSDDITAETSTQRFDLDDSHHFLIIMLGEEATVYIDGDLIFERVEVSEHGGNFGLEMVSAGRRTSCEANEVWVFNLDDAEFTRDDEEREDDEDAVCMLTNNGGSDVNIRSGPGTEFAVQGTLRSGDTVVADGQAVGALNAVWWRLEDGGWVRNDLVEESDACSDLPEVSP